MCDWIDIYCFVDSSMILVLKKRKNKKIKTKERKKINKNMRLLSYHRNYQYLTINTIILIVVFYAVVYLIKTLTLSLKHPSI